MEENSSVPTGFLCSLQLTRSFYLLFLFFLRQDLADQRRFHSLILHFFHMNIQSVDLHITRRREKNGWVALEAALA